VFTITKQEFENYRQLSKDIVSVLCDNNKSSIYDIKIIYNILMGFPFCLDQEGHYIYHGEYYNSAYDLPQQAKEELKNKSEHTII
jgi:hypothetical protein